jgi:hypothetical protein
LIHTRTHTHAHKKKPAPTTILTILECRASSARPSVFAGPRAGAEAGWLLVGVANRGDLRSEMAAAAAAAAAGDTKDDAAGPAAESGAANGEL